MKGARSIGATLFAAAVLAVAVPAGAAPHAAFKHYVACGLKASEPPAHLCARGAHKGAFFRSNDADVFYKVCVKFPNGQNLCAQAQRAAKGKLYVNRITSNIPGRHKVTWFVKGKRVGVYFFRVKT
ncbi:MAG: hypothetical protein U0R52_01530 [Solirubrobacterales bacterium]